MPPAVFSLPLAVDVVATKSIDHETDWLNRAILCPTFWAIAVGAIALLLLIPGGRALFARSRLLGGMLVALSGMLFAWDLPQFGPLGVQIVFWLMAMVTLGSGVAMISSYDPLYSALWFALSLLGTAGLFLMQGAQFLGGATIVVYAGAIVVTFLFVIMLAQPEGHAAYDRLSWGWLPRPAAIVAAAILVGMLAAGMSGWRRYDRQLANDRAIERTTTTEQLAPGEGVLQPQHMAMLGRKLFTGQLIGVEVAGTLLMAALVGAISIAIHGKQSSVAAVASGRSLDGSAISHGMEN